MRLAWKLIPALLFFLLTGCSMEASLQQIASEVTEIVSDKAKLIGFTSGSTQPTQTQNNYTVQTTTGAPIGQSVVKTSGGYSVSISVQGNGVTE